MPFSLGSYLLGVGTVVGALAFGFSGGVMLTHTAMKETPAGPTRVERVARAEPQPSASPQASNTQAAAQATAPAQARAPDQTAVTIGKATDQDHPASIAVIKQDTPPPEQPAAVRPDPVPAAAQPEPEKQAAREPQPPKQVERTERTVQKPSPSREATDRKAEIARRYAERRPREAAAPRMRPRRYEAQDEPEQEIVVSRPPEQPFDFFRGFFGRPADEDD